MSPDPLRGAARPPQDVAPDLTRQADLSQSRWTAPWQIVRRTRAGLAATVVVSAALWGVTVGLIVVVLTAQVFIASVMGVVTALALMWRDRRVLSIERVALWIEEHQPALQFALVTAVTARPVTADVADALARAVAAEHVDVTQLVGRAALRRAARIALPFVGAVALTALVPAESRGRLLRSVAGFVSRDARPGATTARLAGLTVTVVPPAYSRMPRREVRDPAEVRALVGSTLIISGRGDPGGLGATIGGRSVAMDTAAGAWRVSVEMPAKPALVRLTDQSGVSRRAERATPVQERLLTLEPIADTPPTVELLMPARDSVMRHAPLSISVSARAVDDIGLADAHFEIIVTAGDEEAGGVHGQTFRLADRRLDDARSAVLNAVVHLPSLALTPGAVVSIRAVARDGNTVGGPGVGTSDTRTFRIARADEYDTAAVEGATVPIADSALLSERIVVIETTALLARMGRRPSIARDSVARASHALAERQDIVRGALSAVVFGDAEGLPVTDALSPPERALLDSAVHAMVDASGDLADVAPRRALREEIKALAMLDSARALARRLYFRGRPPRILVNVDRVRMTGAGDSTEPAFRSPGAAADTLRRRWRTGLSTIVALLTSSGARSTDRPDDARRGAIDSLVALRVEALDSNAPFAAALAEAASALRSGRDAGPALSRGRAAIEERATHAQALRQEWPGR